MSPNHPSVNYTNLNKDIELSPIIKKKQIIVSGEEEYLVPELILDEIKSKNARQRKRRTTYLILSLLLVVIILSCTVYRLVTNQTKNSAKLKCFAKLGYNEYSASDVKNMENRHTNVDIAFLLEMSAKNSINVDTISKNIQGLVNEIQNKFQSAKVRIAVVGYRNYLDNDGEFKINNFTQDMNQVQTFLHNMNPTEDTISNEDVLDVLGAIDKSIDLDWQSANKFVYQIGVSPLRGFCNTDCPEDATEYAGSVLQELFQKISDGCLKYNIIQIDDTQDLMVKEIKDIDLPFNGSQTFHAHNMKDNGLEFSGVTSSVISSISKKLDLLESYFDGNSNQNVEIHDRCLNVQ